MKVLTIGKLSIRGDARVLATAMTMVLAIAAGVSGRGAEPASTTEIALKDGLALSGGGRGGRTTLVVDPVEAQFVRRGVLSPVEGEMFTDSNGRTRTWTRVTAGDDGWISGAALRGGHVWMTHVAEREGIWILNAAGHSMAYVNGEPRAGDVYGYGYVHLPVRLRAGTNTFLFTSVRGRLRARLMEPAAPVFLNTADTTLPDLREGESEAGLGATVVVNATDAWCDGVSLEASVGRRSVRTPLPSIPPLGVRKVGFGLPLAKAGAEATLPLRLTLRGGPTSRVGGAGAVSSLELRVRRSDQAFKRTFVSGIDGSVQYFAVQPASTGSLEDAGALFLSLHGASVEAMGQAEAYAPKRWGNLVCPTNRRPYGFDWEDWGRTDAMEVLDLATRWLNPHPDQIYLTGHSMGGHGTWSVGVTFPDRFAAVAPSAGWISFQTYAGADGLTNGTPVERMLRRASASGDTLGHVTNLLHAGVYVLHGDADDNVPVTEARRMREVLGGFHRDVDWHEQVGAGHWWDNSDEPGAECVDWPPMFDYFARHRRTAPSEVRQVRFVTVNPVVSSRAYWVAVESQQHSLEPTSLRLQWDPGKARVKGETTNARRLVFDGGLLAGRQTNGVLFELDGQTLGPLGVSDADANANLWGWKKPVRLERRADGTWASAAAQPSREKGPRRSGPFKEAFRHRMLFVYGTRGTPEENGWALTKARFDAESFWYRGNGSVDVIADTALVPAREKDRGIILYGHADMNAAWALLLKDSPVQVRRGFVAVGGHEERGEDLTCLFLRPRGDSEVASVGVVAGTGMVGLRGTQRLPYFMAGTGYPDCLVFGAEAFERGVAGVKAAGFFGPDWSVESGDWAWAGGR